MSISPGKIQKLPNRVRFRVLSAPSRQAQRRTTPSYEKATTFKTFIEFCQQTDVLIHHAQYLHSDMPAKQGWGRDPARTDDELDTIRETVRAWLRTQDRHMQCPIAYEDRVVDS